VLTPEQAQALLRELIDSRILSCVHLESVFDLAQSLTISLEDAARVSEDRAIAMADALLAPALRRLPTLLQCYVRVERAMRSEVEHAMKDGDVDAASAAIAAARASASFRAASGRTTAARDPASAIDPPPASIDTRQRCPGPSIQPPQTRPPPPPNRPRAKKR
jgi:hypothetical protein